MKKIGLIIILFFVSASMAFAQNVLTLRAAIDSALRNNLEIAIARTDVEAAAINNHISIAGGLPTVTFTGNDVEQITSVNQKLNNGTEISRNAAAGNNLSMNVTGSLLVFNGWRVVATKRRLEELQKLSEAQLSAQIQDVVANVMLRYYDVVRQLDYLQTLNASLALSQKRLEVFQVRKDVGLANNADIFQAQIDVNTTLQNITSQQLIASQAKIDLLQLMNVRDTAFSITDTILVDREVSLDAVQTYLLQNPNVLAAEQLIRVNEQLTKEIAAQRYPAVRLNGGYNYNRNQSAAGFTLLNQTQGPFLGLNVQIPIFNGGATKRQQRVAEVNVTNAELQRDNLLLTLNTSALRAYTSYQNTVQQLQRERDNYELSRKLVDLTQQRFNLGVATVIELREAQRSFEETGFRLVNLSYAAKTAEIELKRLSNQLPL